MIDLLKIEMQGWRALSTDQEAAREFYRSLLTEESVFLFPGGLRLKGRDEVLESIAAQPWESFEIDNYQVLSHSDDFGTIVYHVVAKRQSSQTYEALVSSTYERDNSDWKLLVHQQTPV